MGGKQNTVVLLPGGHGGSRTLSSLSCEREGLSVHIPFDSFPDYRLAESCQEWADTLLLTRGQRFRSRTNPDRLFSGQEFTSCLEVRERPRGHGLQPGRPPPSASPAGACRPGRRVPLARRPRAPGLSRTQGITPSLPQLRL